jgi:hypothetical protein
MKISRSDRYELVRRLPTDSRFLCYQAVHPRRPGRFVVHILNGANETPDALAAYERDASAVASMRHPYILQIVELAALPDGTPVMVSELPDGQTLATWLRAGHVATPGAVARLVAALADALAAAHARGVSHGALGADNVFLVAGGRAAEDAGEDRALGLPKLQGFGLGCLRNAAAPIGTEEAGRQPSSGGAPAGDLADLSALAERLLMPPALDETAGDRTFFLRPRVAAVLARARGWEREEPFESPTAFAAALATALEEEDATVAGATKRRTVTAGAGADNEPRRRQRLVGFTAAVVTAAAAAAFIVGGRFDVSPRALAALPAAWLSAAPPRDTSFAVPASAAAPNEAQVKAAGVATATTTVGTKATPPRTTAPAAATETTGDLADSPPAVEPDGPPARPTRPRSRALRGVVWSPGAERLIRLGRDKLPTDAETARVPARLDVPDAVDTAMPLSMVQE